MKNLENSLTRTWDVTRVLLVFWLSFPFAVNAQKVLELNNVQGCYVLKESESLEVARLNATSQAKLEALNKAGISESIKSTQVFSSSRNAFENQERFYENIQSELQGEITFFEVVDFDQSIGDNGEVMICANTNVTVLKYDNMSRVPISIEVENLDNRYKSGQPVAFDVSLSEEAYLWIFYIDKTERYSLIFPSTLQPNNFIANKNIHLPNSFKESWIATTSETEEKNSLLFVVNKSNILKDLNGINNFNSWAKWYMNLDYTSKAIENIPILIFR
jgi:hypothetical protein